MTVVYGGKYFVFYLCFRMEQCQLFIVYFTFEVTLSGVMIQTGQAECLLGSELSLVINYCISFLGYRFFALSFVSLLKE